MTAAAFLAGQTIRSVKRMDEYVTVKGLSEREVPADLAIWPVAFAVNAGDLAGLQKQIQDGRATVTRYLTENGFEPGELSNAPPQISDVTNKSDEAGAKTPPVTRWEADVTVLLRSTKVDKVKAALETSDRLVQQGIALKGSAYDNKPQFLFMGLNTVKPDMIQEANRNARLAAERFAADANSPVGAVRHAIQGPFEVNDVNSASPERKLVRVVTTVDFYLQ